VTEPRPAATVVLLRDAQQALEVFLVRRAKGSSFMGGAYVFPGGKLDDADSDPALLARVRGVDAADAGAALGEVDAPHALPLFVAAIRETFEEAGVLFGEGAHEGARKRLAAGERLTALAAELGWTLDASPLVPYARWVTPAVEPKRFDARFFLAIAPDRGDWAHDASETIASAWMTPA
jgi:8-oxo-dGTP pyrophosphatase MutT (NUDIX family)